MKQYKKSVFIFRRDLRLPDNTGLLKALAQSREVIPCFIFDPRQVSNKNSYRSHNAIQFMLKSLGELDTALHKKKSRLYFFYGETEKIIEQLIVDEKINAVWVNRDYTPFSSKRDDAIKKICHHHNCEFESSSDLLLNEPEHIKSATGTPYCVFTPFYKRSVREPVKKPATTIAGNFYGEKIAGSHIHDIFKKIDSAHNDRMWLQGGRQEALHLLEETKDLKNYTKTRDFPADKTSWLSAHLKFGTISIREAYHAISAHLGSDHPLLRQLYWRDFFTQLAYNSPFVFGHAFHKKYDALPWKNNAHDFNAWCKGKTGFPIIDAGMRQLNTTGWMHNRVRMIVASFLVKDLHIDWQWGEKYFAQQLIDYDPCVNNGNWQWSASTGADAQPYFRIFNPWLQQKKFDPQCIYIKEWVPELQNVPPEIIHKWHGAKVLLKNYPKPMVDHAKESARAKLIYKNV
jgi:deoxyribodipyrimidine photo-lyase